MKMHSAIRACLVMALAAGTTHAKDLYVNGSSGDDSVSYADNSSSRPFRTLGRAVWGSPSRSSQNASQAAQAGDTVIVAAGTYETTAGTGQRYNPIYTPANSGQAGRPIVIRAATAGTVYLRSSQSPQRQPIIGSVDRNHITWDGFVIEEQYIPTDADTGPVVVWSGTGITLENLTIRGYNRGWDDNHNGIRLEHVNDIIIRNNVISGYAESQNNVNASGITMYDAGNVLIENNEIFDANCGIFLKAYVRGPVTVRKNIIRNASIGVSVGRVGEDNQLNIVNGRYDVYSNIITGGWVGVEFRGFDNITPRNTTIANNTMVGMTGADGGAILYRPGYSGYTNIRAFGNILARAQAGVTAWTPTLSAVSMGYNNYFANSSVANVSYSGISLSAWQTTHGKDQQGTLQVDPQFTNEASRDFRPRAGSPVLGAALDVLDLNNNGSTSDRVHMGAYATGNEVIGPNRGPRPLPPSNLDVD